VRRVIVSAWFLFASVGIAQNLPLSPASQTMSQQETQRSSLERALNSERQAGKAAEDPSIQRLEDELMQALEDEETAKELHGATKGPSQYLQTPVLYATNRKRVGSILSSDPRPENSVELGIVNVTIATRYGVRTDYLPGAQLVSKASSAGISGTSSFDTVGQFQSTLKAEALKGRSARKILLFVHGFNTSFEGALERTALIATELQSPVVPITYSWPSAGSAMQYAHDEDMVRASTEAFGAFLKQLLSNSPVEVVIICHSMGAREVTSVLSDLAKEGFDTNKLSRVVFVAADIFTSEFQSKWPVLSSLKKISYAFYASDSDWPLKVSFFKHDADRLGYANSKLWPPPGATTVNASNVDSILDTFGHSYIENPQLGADIGNWITTGADPVQRGLLRHATPNGTVYYFP